MTSRERLLAVLGRRLPDCVPATPDISNMIPCRLTGKPFWRVYLYNDPPLPEAYIGAAKHFDIDSLMDAFWAPQWEGEPAGERDWEPFIVHRTEDRIVVQRSTVDGGCRRWAPRVTVYYRADSPTGNLPPEKLGLSPEPKRFEPVEGAKPPRRDFGYYAELRRMLGDRGLVGLPIISNLVIGSEEAVYRLYGDADALRRIRDQRIETVERRFEQVLRMDPRPDFLSIPGSGTFIFQTPEIYRRYALPAVKRAVDLATAQGIPTHLHSCGPERELVRIMATETDLTLIDPLEVPPMGDCDLAELKRRYGERIVLKGNLHTTEVMLHGTADDVAAASRQAIDDAAEGGGFILATGDQCGRDTPDENLRAMVETARTYGRY